MLTVRKQMNHYTITTDDTEVGQVFTIMFTSVGLSAAIKMTDKATVPA